MNITAEFFHAATGDSPKDDDLERSNCKRAGCIGHYHCGWSSFLNRPMFMVPSTVIEQERRVAPSLS